MLRYDFDLPVNRKSDVVKRLNSFRAEFNSLLDLNRVHELDSFSQNREVQHIKINTDTIICTTYFNTKVDSQRGISVNPDDINFIAPWYNSINQNKFFGLVFYDNLSNDFVKEYQTKYVRFVKCSLGDYSLNDERFIIYYKFFLTHRFKYILLTDGSDVTINKNPFDFISTKRREILFVGRGKENKLYHSPWNLESISRLEEGLKTKLPNNFFDMAIYNAGIIGGDFFTVLFFLRQINSVFQKLNSPTNNNMAAMHYVLFYYFYPNCRSSNFKIFYKLLGRKSKVEIFQFIKDKKIYSLKKSRINYDNDQVALSDYIFSGFPLNSRFYHYEEESDAYITHK